jgi:hypothetical protein
MHGKEYNFQHVLDRGLYDYDMPVEGKSRG